MGDARESRVSRIRAERQWSAVAAAGKDLSLPDAAARRTVVQRHAIGHAAALAVTERMSPRSVSGRDVRELLNRDGAQSG